MFCWLLFSGFLLFPGLFSSGVFVSGFLTCGFFGTDFKIPMESLLPFSCCLIMNSSPCFAASFKSTDHFPSFPTVAFTSLPFSPCFVTTIVASGTPCPVIFASPALISFATGNFDNSFSWLSWLLFSGFLLFSGCCDFLSAFATVTSVWSEYSLPSSLWTANIVSPSLNFFESSIVTDQFPVASTTISFAKIIPVAESFSVLVILTFAPGTPVPEITLSPSFTGFIVGSFVFSFLDSSSFAGGFGFLLSSCCFDWLSAFTTVTSVISEFSLPSSFWTARIISPALNFFALSIATDQFPLSSTTIFCAKLSFLE